MNFNFNTITMTEFGIGRDDENGQNFIMIPVDRGVQNALYEMVKETDAAMQRISGNENPIEYEPSEKFASMEYLYLPLNDPMVVAIRELHEAVNLDIDTKALLSTENIFCYFARFQDSQGNRITAFRRATFFKGILKTKLVHILDDSLRIIEDNIFKLDADFDFLVDSENVYILRPSGFEFAGKLQNAILTAVPKNIEVIKNELPFVDFDIISEYAINHTRAARYLASILKQKEISSIDKSALKKLCKNTSVNISEVSGRLVILNGHEMGFLEVLDRRRYEVELIRGQPEKFKAASRKQL
jgi:hypothetical protein